MHIKIIWGLIGLGSLLTLGVSFYFVKNYVPPQPLLIKPSSVDSFDGIAQALKLSLFPMKAQNYGIKLKFNDSVFANDAVKIQKAVQKEFPLTSQNMEFNVYKLTDLNSKPGQEVNCENSALFNLKRKTERKWKKNIFFTVCKESPVAFSLFYLTR